MNTKYFIGCTTLNEVKTLYRNLAKQHHPDKGGDVVIMQEINNQYSQAIKDIANGGFFTAEEVDNEIQNAAQYKEAINAIINLEGILIEICGGWIWVTGNTFNHKEILKASGFYFASKKLAWYFRSVEYKVSNRKTLSLDGIRTKYGTVKISGKHSYQIAV